MVEEAEILLPGSFVVLQGIPGDGVANTIDSNPNLDSTEINLFEEVDEDDDEEEEDYHHLAKDSVVFYETTSATTNILNNPTSLLPRLSSLSVQPLRSTTTGQIVNQHDSFIVVDDNEQQEMHRKRKSTTREEESSSSRKKDSELIEQWNAHRRTKQQQERHDWITGQDANKYGDITKMKAENRWWLNPEGRLKVFRDIPKVDKNSRMVYCNLITSLSPGSTVVGTELICLDSVSFETIKLDVAAARGPCSYPRGRTGWLQILKIESPVEGVIVLSVDGYSFLGPSLPTFYTDPQNWFWRVTCRDGAYLREGLELDSKYLTTLTYGSFFRVTGKVINQQGLSRLFVHASVGEQREGTLRTLKGWISEYLNPKSGQQGAVAQPMPFPVPALYKVVLPMGATIRCGIELSTVPIGHAPVGSTLTVVGRAFSQHPIDKCIERLKLAGNGGWISLRLCEHAPDNDFVVQQVGIDGTFDPDSPGRFHLEAQRKVLGEQTDSPMQVALVGLEETKPGDLSEIGSSDSSSNNARLEQSEKLYVIVHPYNSGLISVLYV
eukprot:CAMPEP_0194216204 /NCGR_PEP_ID=MMETSP0156-20130528/18512_1 /TAXON_ID=33649 /ORGANISM="Thalassionema nitzschioides, Strain L26-B" /LENGTH=550 /DNA_ID=CAMNT_0038944915 /DNA_START=262 /DNA_END=1915 /DNA_ORIENTATION=+